MGRGCARSVVAGREAQGMRAELGKEANSPEGALFFPPVNVPLQLAERAPGAAQDRDVVIHDGALPRRTRRTNNPDPGRRGLVRLQSPRDTRCSSPHPH